MRLQALLIQFPISLSVQANLTTILAVLEQARPGDVCLRPVFDLYLTEGAIPVGVQICRELRFPEQWLWLARQGAQFFLHLNNAVGAGRFQPVWRSHLVARAAETQRYVLSANAADADQISPTLAETICFTTASARARQSASTSNRPPPLHVQPG